MEADMFDFLDTILGIYAHCGMAWVVASEIAINDKVGPTCSRLGVGAATARDATPGNADPAVRGLVASRATGSRPLGRFHVR
jgi:hypothetical protein